jgi:hypothetical protein
MKESLDYFSYIYSGSEEQCEQSLQIIERMETSSSQLIVNHNKKLSDNTTSGNKQQKANTKDLIGEISGSEEEEEDESEEEEEGFEPESTNKENTQSIRKQDEKDANESEEDVSSSPVLADSSNLNSPRHDKG